jgi:hypothetical protein
MPLGVGGSTACRLSFADGRARMRAGAKGVPLQRRPVVGVEAGGPGLGAPKAAQEQARMTRDVLDRLLATRSSHRLAEICDCAVALAPSDPTSPTLRCLAIQRGRPRPVSQTRRGECFLSARWANSWSVGPGSPGHRPQESGGGKESVSAAVDQPHSQAAVRVGWTVCGGFCRTWSEIGGRGCAPEHPVALDDATAAAAFGAAGAWLQK